MANSTSFQTQIAAIMDVLAKAAVAEISHLAEEDAVVLRLEIRRREDEIKVLKTRLLMTERELRKAQASSRTVTDRCSVGVQVESPTRRDVTGYTTDSPLEDALWTNAHDDLIQECAEGRPAAFKDTVLLVTQSAQEEEPKNPLPHPVRPSNPHRCRPSSEGFSGIEFQLKVEQTEELVSPDTQKALTDPSTGDLNLLDSDSLSETDEHGHGLWSSVPEMNHVEYGGNSNSPYSLEQHMQVFSTQVEPFVEPSLITESNKSSPSVEEKTDIDLFSSLPVKEENKGHREGHPASSQTVPGQPGGTLSHVMQEEMARLTGQQLHVGPHTLLQASAGNTHLPSTFPLPRSSSHVHGQNAVSYMQAHVPVPEASTAAKLSLRPKMQAMHTLCGIPHHRTFSCSVCRKGFRRLGQLEVHERNHAGVKPYRCSECGKRFTQKTRLKTHLRIHTGERPFSCGLCGKLFSRQDNCMRHERLHSGHRPYSCPQCGKSFPVLSTLELHMKLHS